MATPEELLFGTTVAALFLIVTTPVVASGFGKYYHLLGIYHPTPNQLEEYVSDKPDVEVDDYISEDWITKFGMTYAINFISSIPVLMVVLFYTVVILRIQEMSYGAIFGTGIAILAINSSLRVGDKITTRWGKSSGSGTELLSFGYSFFTSLWVLVAIGATITVLNQTIPEILTQTTEENLGTIYDAGFWGFSYILFSILIPLVTEYSLCNYIDIDDDELDFDYQGEGMDPHKPPEITSLQNTIESHSKRLNEIREKIEDIQEGSEDVQDMPVEEAG
jgi:multisubunit Na+/H+ antiporter MnhG subunit